MFKTFFITIISIFLLTACVSSNPEDSTTLNYDSSSNNLNNQETTMKTAADFPTYEDNKNVRLTTNMGVIELEIYAQELPITGANFVSLVEDGFYDGVIFHRVMQDFMIQGGDPEGTGRGGPGYQIKDEFLDDNQNNRGTISMANAGPNTGGSQFFINVVDNNFLDAKHPVFGKVTKGMEVVDKIVSVETDVNDRPLEEVVIEKAEIF